MAQSKKFLSYEEFSKHNQNKDCWLLISGKVYDVTQFMDEHPGGDQVLLSASGKDATDDFEEVGHSESAREMLKTYYIGDMDVSTIPVKRKYTPPQNQPKPTISTQNTSSGFGIKILQFLLPLLILGLAFAIRQYTKD